MGFGGLINSFFSVMRSIGLSDIIDVAIVTVRVYSVLNLLKKTRAFQLLKGLALFFVVYIVATQLKLKTVTFLIQNLLQVGFIALIVVFQPELRRALEQAGNANIFSLTPFRIRTAEREEVDRLRKAITSICDGVERMSEKHTGALIVMENFTSLDSVKRTGTVVNADITPELIGTVFYEGSPLHDGAMIIHDGRIDTAGCVLPLSDNPQMSKDLGTRHRAALGLSEMSDAITLVVSEETGTISYTKRGQIYRGMDRQSLYDMLDERFVKPIQDAADKSLKAGLFRRANNERK